MKKLAFTYGFIVLLLLGSCVVLTRQASPEQLLMGQWEEVSWELEKVRADDRLNDWALTQGQKREIYEQMRMHDAEIWTFDTEKRLILSKPDASEEILNWNIKGRGHILELKQAGAKIEDFQVHELTDDRMVLYFNFDLQIRGVVKMTFKKLSPQYAQKVQ